VLQCRAEERLTREEHHDELGRGGERLPVRLAAKAIHVIAHLTRVRLQSSSAHLLVGCILRVQKCLERRFCVDDDLLASGR
jgi:hypothetical protein